MDLISVQIIKTQLRTYLNVRCSFMSQSFIVKFFYFVRGLLFGLNWVFSLCWGFLLLDKVESQGTGPDAFYC